MCRSDTVAELTSRAQNFVYLNLHSDWVSVAPSALSPRCPGLTCWCIYFSLAGHVTNQVICSAKLMRITSSDVTKERKFMTYVLGDAGKEGRESFSSPYAHSWFIIMTSGDRRRSGFCDASYISLLYFTVGLQVVVIEKLVTKNSYQNVYCSSITMNCTFRILGSLYSSVFLVVLRSPFQVA